MSKHTPGPWTYTANGEIYAGTASIHICSLFGITAPSYADTETEANGHLIAAAPEMYDLIALFGDAITDMFEQLVKGNWVDDHGHNVQLNKQMLALQGVIKKAIELRATIAQPTQHQT